MPFFNWLERYAAALTEPVHGHAVVSGLRDFLNRKRLAKRVWLRAKRDFVMLCTAQLALVRKHIPANAKRILYVYLGNPNLGDSIMDLSPRVLWMRQGLQVDMYTNTVMAALYKGDPSFRKIVCDPKDLAQDYDFIVLQSYNWKCLKFKWRHYFLKPFASLHGHYYGCEFNRLEFSEAAWRYVMRMPAPNLNDACPAVFNLGLDHSVVDSSARDKNKVALAVGGIVDWRIYAKWAEVMALVHQRHPNLEWVLIGSENGLEVAQDLMKQEGIRITNLVSQLSLHEVFKQLQHVGLLVAADGGLMNVGRAAAVPVVALFAREIHPRMRFAAKDSAFVIHAPHSVGDITPEQIADAIELGIEGNIQALTTKFLSNEPDCVDLSAS